MCDRLAFLPSPPLQDLTWLRHPTPPTPHPIVNSGVWESQCFISTVATSVFHFRRRFVCPVDSSTGLFALLFAGGGEVSGCWLRTNAAYQHSKQKQALTWPYYEKLACGSRQHFKCKERLVLYRFTTFRLTNLSISSVSIFFTYFTDGNIGILSIR